MYWTRARGPVCTSICCGCVLWVVLFMAAPTWGKRHGAGADLVMLPGGVFIMGTNDTTNQALFDDADGESPARFVNVNPFKISKYAITNAEFARFVLKTGYVTDAEKYGWAFVFEPLLSEQMSQTCTEAAYFAPWWVKVEGADWKHPHGPDSSVKGLSDHPVVQMSWNDANQFCSWYTPGGRLPTEAEWEYASRGGVDGNMFPWGNEMTPEGKHRMNIWQSSIPSDYLPKKNLYINGEYYLVADQDQGMQIYLTPPTEGLYLTASEHSAEDINQLQTVSDTQPEYIKVVLEGDQKVMASIKTTHAFYSSGNSLDDGYIGTCPVEEYGPQNDFGMHNMVGNVWEWVADWWTTHHQVTFPYLENPAGPESGDKKVLKGGSFICNWLTCPRMRPSGRKGLPPDSGSDTLGFRCAS
ncbi:sulfatase-modifying factor 1 [Pelomyxa schiedti]|nr:sulfatase-modifying factor 1 [Pelomyxa schiedti]